MLPEWSWARKTLSEYRSTTSLRSVALCSRCDYARILPARAVREYSPSIALPFTRGEGSHMEDDNGVIIKMKRAGHSLATIDRYCEARWSAAEVIRRYCVKRKRALATSYTKFAFYERDRRCIFDTVVSSFFILYHIPEIQIPFREVALYLARCSTRRLIYGEL